MRHWKKIAVDFGTVIPSEELSDLLTRPTQIQIKHRPVPYVQANITWRDDPRFPKGIKTIPQINFLSSDEWKILRFIEKYGGKIIPIQEDLGQSIHEETDLTNTGKEYNFEVIDEIISGDWEFRKPLYQTMDEKLYGYRTTTKSK